MGGHRRAQGGWERQAVAAGGDDAADGQAQVAPQRGRAEGRSRGEGAAAALGTRGGGGGGDRRPPAVYGRKFRTGDRLGVLYHPVDRTLTFFDAGLSMGVAFRGVGAPPGGRGGGASAALYPLLHLPGLPGEAVAFVPLADMRSGGGGGARLVDAPRGAAALAASARRWVSVPHPRDGQLCVTTAAEAVTYWLPVADPARTTVGAVKARLAVLSGHAVGQVELLLGGGRLDRDAATLATVGVRFVEGQCACDLMLYVPHLVS